MTATTKTRKSTSKVGSIVDRFEGTIIEQPIVIANKTFLAGLGLASQVQTEFDAKFEELAGTSWEEQRDAYDFYRDELAQALTSASNQSEESARQWVEPPVLSLPALSLPNGSKGIHSDLREIQNGPRHRTVPG